jgi:hypothetical protein
MSMRSAKAKGRVCTVSSDNIIALLPASLGSSAGDTPLFLSLSLQGNIAVPSAQNIGARPNARTGGMVLVPQPWNISTLAWGWGSLVTPKSCRVGQLSRHFHCFWHKILPHVSLIFFQPG